jgi:hypothetical protein
MNAQYDPTNTLDLGGYYRVQGLSQARNMLGQKAVSGRLINLIDYEQFNNLLTDERFSNWFFNNEKPLALNYPTPNEDKYFEYQGMLFIKLSDQTPLPKNAAGETRTFICHFPLPHLFPVVTFTFPCPYHGSLCSAKRFLTS